MQWQCVRVTTAIARQHRSILQRIVAQAQAEHDKPATPKAAAAGSDAVALEEDGDYVMPESPGKPNVGATATGAAASPASATADSDEEARVPFSAAVVAKHASAILKVLRSEQDGIDAAAAYECLVFLTEHEVPQTMCEWAVDKVPTTTVAAPVML